MRPTITLLLVAAFLIVGAALTYAFLDVKNLNGKVLNNGGAPIANANVTLAGRSTFSDNQGNFDIQVPGGEWQLTTFANGYAPAEQMVNTSGLLDRDFSTTVTLAPLSADGSSQTAPASTAAKNESPKTAPPANVANNEPAQKTLPSDEFHGIVRAGDTQQPLAGAQIEVAGQTAVTDATGQFILRGIKDGAVITVIAPGYHPATIKFQPTNALATDPPVELTLAPDATRVTVLDDYTGKPLANLSIAAGALTVTTDAQGQAQFSSLANGTSVTAQLKGYAPATVLYNGQDPLTLKLRPTTFDGAITDSATGKPISGTLVLYNNQLIQADANGAFHLDDVPEQFKLQFKQPGYLLSTLDINRSSNQQAALQPFEARGLHIYYAMPRASAEALLDRFKDTELNAVVFDVKEGPGDILWDSQVPLAQSIHAYRTRDFTAPDMVQICRDRKLYCIARMTIFKDTKLANARPDLALSSAPGILLNDGTATWLNPAKTEVWDYDIALAKELAAIGFDEIQFDYIRFPGRPAPMADELGTPQYRVATIQSFLEAAAAALRPLPVFFSGDIFGLTTSSNDEQGIGQLLETTAPHLDYASPMMYPSTWRFALNLWGTGFGIKDCTDAHACPYEIMRNGMLTTIKRLDSSWTRVRPWLQAYSRENFGPEQFLQEKKGADDGSSDGWLFWNNAGVYPDGLFEKR